MNSNLTPPTVYNYWDDARASFYQFIYDDDIKRVIKSIRLIVK